MGKITCVVMDEKLDAIIATKFKEVVKDLAESGKLKILIDIGNTRFMDSAGCGALVASLRVLLKNGGDMKIAGPSGQVRTLFDLTRLYKVFEVFDDKDSALKSFS